MAYILEYYYKDGTFMCDNVFINFEDDYCIRVYDGYIKDEALTKMKVNIGEFDEALVLDILKGLGRDMRCR